MSETVYNLFLIWQDEVCATVRYVTHHVDMNDKAALDFLLSRVALDLNTSKAFSLKTPFTREYFDACTRLGYGHLLYDEVFEFLKSNDQPLSVVTPVVNGIPQIKFKSQLGDPNIYLRPDMLDGGQMDDWLIKYMRNGGLQLSQLINDDYFLAIKMLYNAKLYVSSMKLLLSAIDSLAYFEFGNINENVFIKWINTYADLRIIAITAEELWELRNGLLHMTNLSSKKVTFNKIRQISFHIGIEPFFEKDKIHYFSFHTLIMIIASAHVQWLETYNQHTEKMVDFVRRYDKTVSDSRFVCHLSASPTEA